MNSQLNIITIKQPTKRSQDAYRVAYWYALQAYLHDSNREEAAEHAAKDAVDRVSYAELEPDDRGVHYFRDKEI
jgi:hypothetical protein